MFTESWFWIFNAFIGIFLLFDLVCLQKKAKEISPKEAVWASVFSIALALLFNLFVYYKYGAEDGINFLTAYLVEKGLSIDNLFVFIIIFSCFQVPKAYIHKVLFWGIFGAIIMRAFFVLFGLALLQTFHWTIYFFGLFLLITGMQFFREQKEIDPEANPIVRFFRKIFPVTTSFEEGKFFVRKQGKLFATPLFLTLLCIETTDVVFAVDSIPAVIGITEDPFIVYTSNIFAILGLRSLYFVLEGLFGLFCYLNYALGCILFFIGFKMLFSSWITVPVLGSLGFVFTVIVISIICSIIFPKKDIMQ